MLGVERNFRKRLILVHVSLVLVIGLSAATAVFALRSTRQQATETREIDQRLAVVDHLRAQTRELALSRVPGSRGVGSRR